MKGSAQEGLLDFEPSYVIMRHHGCTQLSFSLIIQSWQCWQWFTKGRAKQIQQKKLDLLLMGIEPGTSCDLP